MKRVLTILLSLIIAILFCACQPTPEEATVVQKDSDRLIEDSIKENEESTNQVLSEQYEVPENYEFDCEGADGKLNVHVDAIVDVPDENAIPIYRVKATEFSQEIVDAFFQVLCGDAEMYVPSGQSTKDQIQDQIVNIKKNMDITPEPELAEAEKALEDLEKQLETAPDTIVEERTFGELTEMFNEIDNSSVSEAGADEEDEKEPTTLENTSYMGLDAYERYQEGLDGKGRIFQVKNNNTPTIMYVDYRNLVAGANFEGSSFPVYNDDDVDEEALSKIGLEMSEAKKMAQEFLDKTNSDMVVDSVYLQKDNDESPKYCCYKIYCVRNVDGISCSSVAGGSQPETDTYAPTWIYEELTFTINNDGIISMHWCCPIEVIETVNDDAQLKPFSEIQEIFEKMMSVKYEPAVEFGGDEYDFEINRVTLSLHRVVEQNSNESGLLVPAWNFYGKLTVTPSGGSPTGEVEYLGESYMTINAIDGSIIDTSLGY